MPCLSLFYLLLLSSSGVAAAESPPSSKLDCSNQQKIPFSDAIRMCDAKSIAQMTCSGGGRAEEVTAPPEPNADFDSFPVPSPPKTAAASLSSSTSTGVVDRTPPPLYMDHAASPVVLFRSGDANGPPVTLRGINWFGFNTDATMVDGLWAGGPASATDFSTIVTIITNKSVLGFNTVRLPFTFAALAQPTRSFRRECWVDVAASDDVMAHDGVCNDYIPDFSSATERFLWTIDFFVRRAGVYVVIDEHSMGRDLSPKDPPRFVAAWLDLWRRIADRPHLRGRVLLDLINEPDASGMTWTGSAADVYLQTMDALDKVEQPIFVIEGCGQGNLVHNWGDGFATDPATVKAYGIDDASGFFERLASKPYKTRVVISPHIYGPTISNSVQLGSDLSTRLEKSFGYLATHGYCSPSLNNCDRYPILLGEFGSFFKDPRDREFYDAVALWSAWTPGKILSNWIFWAWNANCGDTGGLLTPDWQKLNLDKARYLREVWGLGS
jgi:endoglucanase